MNSLDRNGLGNALAERVLTLVRTSERLRALEDYRESEAHAVGQPDAEAVLRRALLSLSSHEGYDLAGRILSGESVPVAEEFARAGLVIWDPGSDSQRPTALLIELMRLFEPAVREAHAER